MPIPREIQGQNYISLVTFRKSGAAVATPVWFGEEDGKLYVMARSDSGKCKRVRNNSSVRIAPCTMRGKVNGPGVRCHSSHLAARRLSGRAKDHPAEILAGTSSLSVEQNQRVSGNCGPVTVVP